MCVLNVPRAEHFTHANTRHPSIAIWRFRLKIDKYKTRTLQYYYYIIYSTYTNLYSSAFGARPRYKIHYIQHRTCATRAVHFPLSEVVSGKNTAPANLSLLCVKVNIFYYEKFKGKKKSLENIVAKLKMPREKGYKKAVFFFLFIYIAYNIYLYIGSSSFAGVR